MTVLAASQVAETAYAKINLTLRILGKRADGYHELQSLVAFADVGDRLTLIPITSPEAASASPPLILDVTGPFGSAIAGENLITKAVERTEVAAGRRLAARVHLDKQLPVAAGVGGGSADAAAALRALRTAHPDLSHRVDWLAIAASLGADVPVCLESRSASMTGIGERLSPVDLPSLHLVLANPRLTMPPDKTRRVFQALAAAPLSDAPTAPAFSCTGLEASAVVEIVRSIGNDLERPALQIFPAIGDVKAAVSASAGCRVAFLSGAGPTVAGIFDTALHASAAAIALSACHSDWWVAAAETLCATRERA